MNKIYKIPEIETESNPHRRSSINILSVLLILSKIRQTRNTETLISENTQSKNQEINALTNTIIGCAYKVHNQLGFGFLESVYEKSLLVELKKASINAVSQAAIKVYYDNETVGDFYADILVQDQLIVELKSLNQLSKAHEVQLVNYLSATNIENGLLINFGPKKVELKRKFKTFLKK